MEEKKYRRRPAALLRFLDFRVPIYIIIIISVVYIVVFENVNSTRNITINEHTIIIITSIYLSGFLIKYNVLVYIYGV